MAYWFVSSKGYIRHCQGGKWDKDRKEFGDHFRTQAMAKEAKKRMAKLFRRLKAK